MSPSASADRVLSARAHSAHLVLLGLPGAGKSTVGPLVATALGRPFVDLDAAIEQRAGRSIAEIFALGGETEFRAHEHVLTTLLLGPGAPLSVFSPGGGWVEDPLNRAASDNPLFSVYLRVSPSVAIARMEGETRLRPLLDGPDPLRRVEELLRRREMLYLQSDHTVSTDLMSPEEVAASIVALASG